LFSERLVFLDLETTGGSAIYDRIIEIGLVEIDCGRLVREWSTLVNPARHIPQGIQTLTGITDEAVTRAPSFDELAPGLAARLEGKVLAAHNASFDYGFLRNEFRRVGVLYTPPVLCTVKLSRRLFPQHPRHNLDALLIRHSLFCLERHRALGDARVLWELAQIWQRDPGIDIVEAACAELLRKPSVPAGLPPEIFDELPESPGVYVFHGENDTVLYVGRSANIRSRVIAHFSGTPLSGKDANIARAVKRVECIETAGELGAYVREAELVVKLAPVYNRRHSRESQPCAWRWSAENFAAPPELIPIADAEDARELYGLFRSRSSALAALRGLARAYELCHAAVGIERLRANTACSAHAHGRCRGACVGTESRLSHGMRVAQAFANLRVKPWPYPGRIGVRERDPNSERTELHVLDSWRYVGTVHSEAELHELSSERNDAAFDLDTYKMLARFLKSPPSRCEIISLDRHA
jgi:DNA polymerase-3 subunit epsilon